MKFLSLLTYDTAVISLIATMDVLFVKLSLSYNVMSQWVGDLFLFLF